MEESKKKSELRYCEVEIFGKYIIDVCKRLKTDIDTQIYMGRKKETNEEVVFKLKEIKSYEGHYLKKESYIYEKIQGIKRIPKLYDFGSQGNYYLLVIELLGPSLKWLLESVEGKFSLATTLKIGVQVLEIIKEIHKKGVVLRYLKPGNIVIGSGENKDYIYLLDFEIAKEYIKNGVHIPYRTDIKIKGNRDYISLNVHYGNEVSRRDDIESFGYNLIVLLKGELPWSHIKRSNDILEKKENISLDELCEGCPEEFKEIIKYSKELGFTEEPNYSYLNLLLKKAAEKNGIDIDKVKYDWDIKKEKEKEGKNINDKREEKSDEKIEEENLRKDKENENKNNDEKKDEINYKEDEKNASEKDSAQK